MPVPTPARSFTLQLPRRAFPLLLLTLLLLPSTLFARGPQPDLRIPLEPLGLLSPSQRSLLDGSSMLTLHYVDNSHLLLTFVARRLIRRIPNDPPTDQDRNVDALLLEIPSGRILARAEWVLHDHGQYLWNLGSGQFMLRIRDTFTTFAPVANSAQPFQQRSFIHLNRHTVAVLLSSDAGLLTLESTDPIPLVDLPDDDDAPRRRPSYTQLNLYRLSPSADTPGAITPHPVGRAFAEHPVGLPLSPTGILRVLDQGNQRWAFDFLAHTGKTSELALFDSTCPPVPLFISPSEFIAFGCHGGTVRQQLAGFNLHGDAPWQMALSGPYLAPSLDFAPAAGRFALERLLVNSAAIDTQSLVPEQLDGQTVDVIQNDSGKQLLHIDCSPIARAGQNFALSPTGMSLAVIRAEAIEIYALPPLSPADKTAIKLAQNYAPPPDSNDGPIDLSVLSTKDGSNHKSAPCNPVTPTATPTATPPSRPTPKPSPQLLSQRTHPPQPNPLKPKPPPLHLPAGLLPSTTPTPPAPANPHPPQPPLDNLSITPIVLSLHNPGAPEPCPEPAEWGSPLRPGFSGALLTH